MFDRASVVDAQFITRVRAADFPAVRTPTTPSMVGLTESMALDLFDSQLKSRHLDLIGRQLKEKGLGYYTIGSSGHEGNAVFGQVFPLTDMAFVHYRSGAFFIQRSKQRPHADPVRDTLLSLMSAAADPISGGRHKVFGSYPLNLPPQTSTIASHLPKALGAAFSINRAMALGIAHPLSDDALIICSFGDASLNHASTQTTLNAASWMQHQHYPLPLVLICEDNGIGISVPTPADWVERSVSLRPYMHYIACDGLNLADCYGKAVEAAAFARSKKQPVFLHMRCVRLLGHAGSDIESQYHSQAKIDQIERDDPLLHTACMLYREGWLDLDAICERYETARQTVAQAADALLSEDVTPLADAEAIMASLVPKPRSQPFFATPTEEVRQAVYGAAYEQLSVKRNLCQQINFALTDLMLQYPHLVVFGEDVGKKGGVYRVTADLQTRFGQRRVFDTLLDETTILGTAIGMAHNGFLPVPEIQFLAYFHNAEDQLRGEAATLSFFSNGLYQNPLVLRLPALGYQKGFGGHFHNDNSITVLRDLPGVIIACPSNGASAAMLLRRCVKLAQMEGRVVIFLEPIALYMTKDLHEPGDNEWLFSYPPLDACSEFGEVGVHGEGDTVILSYANGYYLSRQAAAILKKQHQIDVKVVDLQWLSPLPIKAIVREIRHAKRVLIVDEGRRSGSVSEGLMALLMEQASNGLVIERLTGDDCFIPLGPSWASILPSRDKIIKQVLKET